MNNFLKSAILASSMLVGLNLPSNAVTMDVPPSFDSGTVPSTTTFTTDYEFDALNPVDASVIYAWSKFAATPNATVAIYEGTTPTGTPLGAGSGTTPSGTSILGPGILLAAGDFNVQITGNGQPGASYDLKVNVSPVPLPASLYLFVGGIALMGFFMWRRNRQDMSVDQSPRLTIA
jgi:hypothetical protein